MKATQKETVTVHEIDTNVVLPLCFRNKTNMSAILKIRSNFKETKQSF